MSARPSHNPAPASASASNGPIRYWADLTTDDFSRIDVERTVAILPVAAIEQHGPHLPLSVDADLNAGILARALARVPGDVPCLALPPQVVGKSDEHAGFPGTLTISPEVLIAQWTDIGACVAATGIRRIILFNSHGGQPQIVDIVAQTLRNRFRMLAIRTSWTRLVDQSDLFADSERRHGIHGGADETSMMLYLHPERVRRDRIADFRPADIARDQETPAIRVHGAARYAWRTEDLNPVGAVGDARLATAEAGQIIIDRAAEALAAVIVDAGRFDLSVFG